MDSSKKPESVNPRQNVNIIQQLLFTWIIPLLYKGSKNGLTTNDLTVCLDKDKSEMLGDKLEV